ncbi:hypothetical protein DL96DRAFT_1116399 [Flagelloscypha sp. PMI_526]|nr:hypothetical protein DL96DRAFT_1116399 [Flagelloscypha sp. PMI_526]
MSLYLVILAASFACVDARYGICYDNCDEDQTNRNIAIGCTIAGLIVLGVIFSVIKQKKKKAKQAAVTAALEAQTNVPPKTFDSQDAHSNAAPPAYVPPQAPPAAAGSYPPQNVYTPPTGPPDNGYAPPQGQAGYPPPPTGPPQPVYSTYPQTNYSAPSSPPPPASAQMNYAPPPGPPQGQYYPPQGGPPPPQWGAAQQGQY